MAGLAYKKRKGTEIAIEDIKKVKRNLFFKLFIYINYFQVYSLFLDEQRSCEFLKEYESEYMFNYSEVQATESNADQMETSN